MLTEHKARFHAVSSSPATVCLINLFWKPSKPYPGVEHRWYQTLWALKDVMSFRVTRIWSIKYIFIHFLVYPTTEQSDKPPSLTWSLFSEKQKKVPVPGVLLGLGFCFAWSALVFLQIHYRFSDARKKRKRRFWTNYFPIETGFLIKESITKSALAQLNHTHWLESLKAECWLSSNQSHGVLQIWHPLCTAISQLFA